MIGPQRPRRWSPRARQSVPLIIVLLLGVPVPLGAAAPYAGRPVAEVLREYEAQGFVLIYNDDLVPPTLRVPGEPRARAGAPLLEEVLASVGLGLTAVGPMAWAVVRAPAGPAAVPPQQPARGSSVEEVVVSTSRYALAQEETRPHHFLTRQELQSLPTIADESLRAVQRLPGAATNGISGLAHIRGGEESETRIVLDGLPLYDPFHLRDFFTPVSVLDPRMVGSLDVYTGGFPVTYGDRMSAVVDVRSVDPGPGGYYELGLSLFHLGGLAAGGFADERGRWLVAGRRSNLGELADLVDSDVGEPSYVDFFGRLSYDFGDRTTAALHLLAAKDDAELNDTDRTEFAAVRYRNLYAWGSLEHRATDALTLRAIASLSDVDSDRTGTVSEPGSRMGTVEDRRRFDLGGLRLEADLGGPAWLYRFGAEASHLEADYRYRSELEFLPGYPFPADPGLVRVQAGAPQPRGWQLGAWLSGRWHLGERVTAEAGLRWDEQTYTVPGRDSQFSPRLNLLFTPRAGTQLRASWGRFYQPQAINELQVEDGVYDFFPAQRADHLIVGIEQILPARVRLRLEAYAKDYDALRPRFENLLDPVVLLPELEPDRIAIDADSAQARGVEVLLTRAREGDWSWWLSYTWSRVEDSVAGVDIPRTWDQRHAASGGMTWARGPWEATLAGTWHTGWRTTPATLENAPDQPPGAPPQVVFAPRNSARLGSYRSLDLRLARTFGLGVGEILVFAEITNLVNFANPCCVELSVVESDTGWELVRDEDNWLGPVPNLGVLWRFRTPP